MKLLHTSWMFGRWCLGCMRDFFFTLLWLALAAALFIQLTIISSHQLPMPDWMLRKLEARLTANGLKLQIGNATMDPAGHILIRDVQMLPPGYDEALARIDKVYIRLNPIALLHGNIRPEYIHVNGLNLQLPAMLSPTGKTEPVVSDIRFSFRPKETTLGVDDISGRIANLTFAARGSLSLPSDFGRAGGSATSPSELASYLKQYANFSRLVVERASALDMFERPHLDVDLSSRDNRFSAALVFTCEKVRFDLSETRPELGQVQISDLRVSTKVPIGSALPDTVDLDARCASAVSSAGPRATRVRAHYHGPVKPSLAPATPAALSLSTGLASYGPALLESSALRLRQNPGEPVSFDLAIATLDSPWRLEGECTPGTGTGNISFEGAITNTLIGLVASRLGQEPEKLVVLREPAPVSGTCTFGDQWKLLGARSELRTGHVIASSVPFNSLKGTILFDGTVITVADASATQGENQAQGTCLFNLKNRDFRFLLSGAIRPLDISDFFESWWPHFWRNFNFDRSPTNADVDVAGRWGSPFLSTVFVNVDVSNPIVREVSFDHINTTLFIRPDFYHAIELRINRGEHLARGWFTRAVDLYKDTDDLKYIDFDFVSSLDLTDTAQLFGQEGIETVEPFLFVDPPALRAYGHVDGPASGKGSHRYVQLALKSSGNFFLYDFPLKNLTFSGSITDNVIDLPNIQVTFAQGNASGSATISGPTTARELRFDAKLDDALLGDAISTLEQYSAKERGEPPPEQSKFQRQVADGRLSLNLTAQGMFSDLYSFYGHGSMELTGAQLAQINLFGSISQVLSKSPVFKFTTLEFDKAKSSFVLERDKLRLPDLKISGKSAIIEAKGAYSLDQKTMEFDAKFYPFGQSKTLLANAVGFVLVPVSNALELKLSGALEKPNWRLAHGPTSFLYNLTGTNPSDAANQEPSSPASQRPLPTPYLRH